MVLILGMTIVGCEEETTVTGGTITVRNTSSETYEVRIINGYGVNITSSNIAAYARRDFSVDSNDSYTVEYRIFWTTDTWKQRYISVSNGGTVTVDIP
jgi:hypothetical protein